MLQENYNRFFLRHKKLETPIAFLILFGIGIGLYAPIATGGLRNTKVVILFVCMFLGCLWFLSTSIVELIKRKMSKK